jgi:hypothetical protein
MSATGSAFEFVTGSETESEIDWVTVSASDWSSATGWMSAID